MTEERLKEIEGLVREDYLEYNLSMFWVHRDAIRDLLAEVRRLRGRLPILPPRKPYIPPRTCEFEGEES